MKRRSAGAFKEQSVSVSGDSDENGKGNQCTRKGTRFGNFVGNESCIFLHPSLHFAERYLPTGTEPHLR